MPRYDFDCPSHGRFERTAGFDDDEITHECGALSPRVGVYVEQSVTFKGGGFTKSVLPPPGPDAQAEFHKEVRKRGWDGDRAVSEIRKNMIENADGTKSLNAAAMTKEA